MVITLVTALLDQHPDPVRQHLFHNIYFALLENQLGTNGICKNRGVSVKTEEEESEMVMNKPH